jgi:RNA recognition motif. (a.k.a. RRM, RBD, or RNP domain)
MKFCYLNSEPLLVAFAAAVAVSSLCCHRTADAFSLAPRGGLAPNPFVSVARRVALSDPNTSAADIEAEPSPSSASEVDGAEASAAFAVPEDADDAPAAVRHTVYVGNLPFTATEESVRSMFEGTVTVKAVALPTNPNFLDPNTGMPSSKGFGFVDVEDESQVERAISVLNGLDVEGRLLRVNKLMSKEEVNSMRGAKGPGGLPAKKPYSLPEGEDIIVVVVVVCTHHAMVRDDGCLFLLVVAFSSIGPFLKRTLLIDAVRLYVLYRVGPNTEIPHP